MFDVFYEIGRIIGVILGNALVFVILLGIYMDNSLLDYIPILSYVITIFGHKL
jgi:hypothetical protein